MRRSLSFASSNSLNSSSSLHSTCSSEAKDVDFDSTSDVVPSSAIPLFGGGCNVADDAEPALPPFGDFVGVVDINQR